MNQPEKVNAGVFSSWYRRTRYMLLTGDGISVPCAECRACCTSSKFIHIYPQEKESISRIPKSLLFKAPLSKESLLLMGYDQNGHCPMYKGNSCAIYPFRPRTCHNFDCRVFTAAGLLPEEDNSIREQVKRWLFSYPHESDHKLHQSITATAKFIREHSDIFPDGKCPPDSGQLAVFAVKVACTFSKCTQEGKSEVETAEAIVFASREFERKRKAV